MAIGRINATLSGVQPGGLAKIVPTSVAVGSGSGSVDGNGNVSFSGASTVSLNGCFSSAYDNYKIMVTMNGTVAANAYLRLRVGGSDNSSGIYKFAGILVNDNSATIASTRSTGQTFWTILRNDSVTGYTGSTTIELFDPFATRNTKMNILATGFDATPRTESFIILGSTGSTTTSFDGFTIHAENGTITGTVRVYGYAQ